MIYGTRKSFVLESEVIIILESSSFAMEFTVEVALTHDVSESTNTSVDNHIPTTSNDTYNDDPITITAGNNENLPIEAIHNEKRSETLENLSIEQVQILLDVLSLGNFKAPFAANQVCNKINYISMRINNCATF